MGIKTHIQHALATIYDEYEKFQQWREGNNVIKTITSPNRVTNELLNYHHDEWLDKLSKLKGPFIGFLIGGKSKAYNFNDDECEKIIQALNFVISNGYTPLITLSRRSHKKLSNRKPGKNDKPSQTGGGFEQDFSSFRASRKRENRSRNAPRICLILDGRFQPPAAGVTRT